MTAARAGGWQAATLKGQCHEMDIFLKEHFNQYFLCMRWWFSRSIERFLLPYAYTISNVLFAFWNYLLIFKMLTETLLSPFSVIL